MDLQSILAVMGVVWRRGQSVTLPPAHSIFPLATEQPAPAQPANPL